MKISLIIYLLGFLCGMSFGIAVSMIVDFLANGMDDIKTLGEDEDD